MRNPKFYLIIQLLNTQFLSHNQTIIIINKLKQIKNHMGSSISTSKALLQSGVQQLNKEEWQMSESILKRTSSTAKLQSVSQDCKPNAIYSSQNHSFFIDQYLLDSREPFNIDEQYQEIKWRNSYQQLVHVKYIKGFQSSIICQVGASPNFIYTQHIPLRLSQITDVPFPDNLYLLKACLKGFHQIFVHTRCLEIRQDFICLNAQGKIKVWMNTNLSKNKPLVHNIIKQSKKSEIALVNDIVNIVDLNTDHQFQPKRFKEFLQQFKLSIQSFLECIEAVDHFADLLQVTIPNNLESVYGLFNPLLNKHGIGQFSDTYGRHGDTIQTKMVQSIPLQREQRVNAQQTKSNYIQFIDNYPCQTNQQSKNLQKVEKTNMVFRPVIKTQESFVGNSPSLQNMAQNIEVSINVASIDNDLQWRYFDLHGWAEIDPQILGDLKKISVNF